MLSIKEIQFAGQDCFQLTNGTLTLHALKNAGPRIVGLQINGAKNLLAELPDSVKAGDYILRGGQRVWHGPEDIIRSYQADGEPVRVEWKDGMLSLVQKTEALTGIQKTMTVKEGRTPNELIVDHILTNHNLWPGEIHRLADLPGKVGRVCHPAAFAERDTGCCQTGGWSSGRTRTCAPKICSWEMNLFSSKQHSTDPTVPRSAGSTTAAGWGITSTGPFSLRKRNSFPAGTISTWAARWNATAT